MSDYTRNSLALQKEIMVLKEQKQVVILAHNYQIPEIQEVADFVGDSFELSQIAKAVTSSVIVFCGVHFMAECAKILSPEKKVIIPDESAGCPLADMASPKQVKDMRAQYPQASVVAYVNTSAEVKAESDICCTSSNAIQVVNALEADTVIFLPDRNLANYVSSFTEKLVIPWQGFCSSHTQATKDEVRKMRNTYPDAPILVHPECSSEIKAEADFVMGTGGMVSFAQETEHSRVIIGTEEGLVHRLSRENPGKTFHLLSPSYFCSDMKNNTLEALLDSLNNLAPEVIIPEEIRLKAYRPLDNMLKVG